MEQITEPLKLQVVLRIELGNGLTFVNNTTKVYLVANLNGVILETVPTEARNPVEFNTELVWEVERKNLRQLKLNNVPIKLECFCISNEERNRIGYLMLNLKSAPMISPNSSVCSEKKVWQRLLGVSSNHRVFRPEILLDLFIEDIEKDSEISKSQTKDVKMSLECQDKSFSHIIPQLKDDRGYIQIGPEEICKDIYLIHIFLAAPTNLHQIKINSNERNTCADVFSLFYNICGVDIHTKEFKLGANGTSDFTEKTVLRIRSSLKFLRQYLNQVRNVEISLLSGNIKIAHCKAAIDDIITTDDLNEFLSINRKSYYTVCKCGISYFGNSDGTEANDSKEAYIKTGLSVKYLHPECSFHYKHVYENEIPDAHYNMDNTQTAIDQLSMMQLENIVNNLGSDKKRTDIDQLLQKHRYENVDHDPFDQMDLKDHIKIACQNNDKSEQEIAYPAHIVSENQTYQNPASSKFVLETITEETNSPSMAQNANLVLKRGGGDKIEEKKSNEQISMKIVEELEDWKEKQQEMFLAEESDNQLLYSSRVFLQKQIWYTKLLKVFIETNTDIIEMYQEFVNFMHLPFRERIFNLVKRSYKIWYGSENCQLLWTSGLLCLLNFNYWTPYAGDLFIFLLLQLKKKEEKHLGHLSSEWYKKRTEIETQLKKKIEHSRSLAIALEKANNDAKTAGIKNIDTEKQLIKAKEDLERQYSLQYLDMKEAARRLEDDLNHKLGRSNIIKNELAEKIQALQKENKRLQDLIDKQQEECEAIRNTSLNKEQTASLVRQLKTTYEKLMEAQKSKAFFKEQWARALREVHRIKSDQQQNINVQIKRNKAIDLQAILDEQERAQYDNQELQNITKRLQSLSTDSSVHSSTNEDVTECHQLIGPNNNLSTLLNGMDYFRTGFSSRSSTNTEDSDSDNFEARQILKSYEVNNIDSEDD